MKEGLDHLSDMVPTKQRILLEAYGTSIYVIIPTAQSPGYKKIYILKKQVQQTT